MKKIAALALALSVLPAASFAADPSMCTGCHRAGSPTAPDLAGMPADQFTAAMNEYKSGARSNPTMKAMSMPLSDADIAGLAAHFSALGK
ncbi:MAG: cytochrome c [Gammaproteobacteria bacterium]|nr:cytochrome c [Gammaproteobacteria bacterium]MCP5136085.1 cytochrome c [Gammaproteobacteria bacterium]